MSKSKILVLGIAATTLAAGAGIGAYHIWSRNRKKQQTKEFVNKLVQILEHPHVYVRDSAQLREKLRKIVDGGIEKLQVLSDFDRTLSKFTLNGTKGQTCHGVIEKATCMPEEFRERVAAAKAKYHPLEMSPNLSKEEKIPLMVEWYNIVHKLMVEAGIQKRWIPGMVSEANIGLRDGADELFRILKDHDIPLLILSAGVGDVLEEVVNKQSTMYDNMKIISNYFKYDDEGNVIDFKGEIIHSFNKHEVSLHNKPFFDQFKDRDNLILLGDTLGDPHMADGMAHVQTILKIGYLNSDVERSLEVYKQAYDIVLVEDETVDILNVILKELFKYSK